MMIPNGGIKNSQSQWKQHETWYPEGKCHLRGLGNRRQGGGNDYGERKQSTGEEVVLKGAKVIMYETLSTTVWKPQCTNIHFKKCPSEMQAGG